MDNALKKAAVEASAALGMSVVPCHVGPLPWVVETFGPLDGPEGEGPLAQFYTEQTGEVLAYLRGLEVGARIQSERHARLRRAADDTYLWCCTFAKSFRLTDICHNLKAGLVETEALSQLEATE